MVAFNTVAKPLMPENIQKMITFHTDFQSLHEFVNKGGVISESIFKLVPSSKQLNQITAFQLVKQKQEVEGQRFG